MTDTPLPMDVGPAVEPTLPDLKDFRVVVKVPMRLEFTVKALDQEAAVNQAWEQVGEEGEHLDCCDLHWNDFDLNVYEVPVLPRPQE